ADYVLRHWPGPVRGLFVSGYALFAETTRAAARAAMERARAAGAPIAVDPASYANILDAGARRFLEWCRGATIILPNRHEAAVLAAAARDESGRPGDARDEGRRTGDAPAAEPRDELDLEAALAR